MSKPGRYLVVKSTVGGGLGDRIRAVLSAILYATTSGRNLSVMWDDGLYGPEGENVFPQLFELNDVPDKPLPIPNDLDVLPELWRGQLHHPMKILYRQYGPKQWNRVLAIKQFSFDQSRLDYPQDVLVMWEFDQFGACMEGQRGSNEGYCWENLERVRELAHTRLRLAVSIRKQVEAFKAQYFSRNMIGLHIRNTDEPGCRQKIVPEVHYHRLIRNFRKQSPDTRIFLATDNSGVEQRFRQRYPDLVTTEKWFAADGEALHLSHDRNDKLANASEALMDMFLLAACDHLIYPAWSSFSQVASFFSIAPLQQIHPLRSYGGWRDRIKSFKNICRS